MKGEPMNEKALISAKEAAKYLNISYWLILQLVNDNKIPHVRTGKKIQFKISSLDNWIDEQEFWKEQ